MRRLRWTFRRDRMQVLQFCIVSTILCVLECSILLIGDCTSLDVFFCDIWAYHHCTIALAKYAQHQSIGNPQRGDKKTTLSSIAQHKCPNIALLGTCWTAWMAWKRQQLWILGKKTYQSQEKNMKRDRVRKILKGKEAWKEKSLLKLKCVFLSFPVQAIVDTGTCLFGSQMNLATRGPSLLPWTITQHRWWRRFVRL